MILLLILIIFLIIYNNTFYKNSEMDRTEFVEIKRNNKKMKINKIINIIFIILTILLAISITATIVYGVLFLGMSFITLFGAAYVDTGADSSPYINLGTTTGLFFSSSIFLVYAWIYFLIIKIVINQITLMKRLKENEQFSNHITYNGSKNTLKTSIKKLAVVLITIAIITALIVFTANIFRNYSESNKNLKDVLDDPPLYDMYDETTYYFIYNNKIYYYYINYRDGFTDCLYSMNLDGTENKIIAKTDELKYAHFYFAYNNEAYYYTIYYKVNKKINLETGEITDLGNKDIYLSNTFRNGIIYTFYDNAIAGNAYAKFKKININTNQTLFEIKTKYSMAGNQYYLDYDGNNIYYLEDYYSDYPSIYKNNEIIYQFTDYNRYNFPEIEFIAVNNEYIYFKQNNYLYKLNVETRTIEKEFSCNIGDIKRISSGNNSDNYFYSNNKIYAFDFSNDNFNMILDNVQNMPEYVYNINEKLIFTENTDNLKYLTEEDNLGSAIIYNLKSGEMQTFNNIRKFCYDEKFLYMMIDTDNKYYVEKIPIK